MVELANLIVGTTIIVINLIPFIFRKTNLLMLTGLISLIILFVLMNF